MKTAEEISIECAKESDHSYTKIEDFNAHDWVIKAMKLYANQKLDEAAEKATCYDANEGKCGGMLMPCYYVDPESILSLKDKV